MRADRVARGVEAAYAGTDLPTLTVEELRAVRDIVALDFELQHVATMDSLRGLITVCRELLDRIPPAARGGRYS